MRKSQTVSYKMRSITTPYQFQIMLHARYLCTYWDSNTNNWNSEGCRLLKPKGDLKFCQCDHLTDFTLIVVRSFCLILMEAASETSFYRHRCYVRAAGGRMEYSQPQPHTAFSAIHQSDFSFQDTSVGDPTLCDPHLSVFGTALSSLSVIALFTILILHLMKHYYYFLPHESSLFLYLISVRMAEKHQRKKTVVEWLAATMLLFMFLFVLLSDQRTLGLSSYGCDVAAAILYCILLCTFVWIAFATINYFKVFLRPFYSRPLVLAVNKRVMLPVTCGKF